MKKNIIALLCFLIAAHFSLAQNCQQTFYDYYSDSTLWTHIGPTNNVIVNGGTCQFNDAFCDHYDKVLRQLPFTLSDNYWKAELKFSITATNAPGNGVAANLFVATAGSLDVWSYDAGGGYALTNQDGINISLATVDIYDNNIDNWRFTFYSKKGNTTPVSSGVIFASSNISTYYLRLERFAADSGRLSVFSDTAYINHIPGSPVTSAIDPSITGLSYIQHGVATWGYNTRHLSGIIDSLYICNGGLTGIAEEANKKSIFIYPDPAGTSIKIFTGESSSAISIFNYFGKKVYENTSETNPEIDISSFSNGLYFLYSKSEKNLMKSKFIVLH